MKHLIAVCFMILWTCAYPAAMSRTLHKSSIAETHRHRQWMVQYGRSYTDDAEKEKRLQIFMENLEFIDKFNNARNKSSTYTLGLNQFSDLTNEEFLASHTVLRIPSQPYNSSEMAPAAVPLNLSINDIPTSLDWREQGAVTDVKNQGSCGNCWAFSAVAAVEGIEKIINSDLISLSEQQLLDCGSDKQNQGCGGGFMDHAFQYIIQNKGIASEESYPYVGVPSTCKNDIVVKPSVQIKSYTNVPPNDEQQLLQAVALQPVSVAIAVSDEFKLYTGGVYTGACGPYLNHGVTAIGYGTSEDGKKFWLIKNSWGNGWGEGGYMRLLRDGGDLIGGHCGITMRASYPNIISFK